MAVLRATTRNGHDLLLIKRTPNTLKWKIVCCGWWLSTDHDGRVPHKPEFNINSIRKVTY